MHGASRLQMGATMRARVFALLSFGFGFGCGGQVGSGDSSDVAAEKASTMLSTRRQHRPSDDLVVDGDRLHRRQRLLPRLRHQRPQLRHVPQGRIRAGASRRPRRARCRRAIALFLFDGFELPAARRSQREPVGEFDGAPAQRAHTRRDPAAGERRLHARRATPIRCTARRSARRRTRCACIAARCRRRTPRS